MNLWQSAADPKCGLILQVLRILAFIYDQYGVTEKKGWWILLWIKLEVYPGPLQISVIESFAAIVNGR